LRAWLIESTTNQGTNKATDGGTSDRARVTVVALARHITQCTTTESTRSTANQGVATRATRDPLPVWRMIRTRLTSASGQTDADEQDGPYIAETGFHKKDLLLSLCRTITRKTKNQAKRIFTGARARNFSIN
jgi:hypothetical protein